MSSAHDGPSLFDLIYAAIRQIPEGKVASYGQIASIVGRCTAQMVGFALAALGNHPGDPEVPWYRVVNASGKVALTEDFERGLQRSLLEQEGVEFDLDGVVDFQRYGWLGTPHSIKLKGVKK
jgi:methylated-DNA-protein-cysteine methyltransferase-like protein